MDPRGGKRRFLSVSETRVWTDTRALDRSYSDGLSRVDEDQQEEAVPAQHWFWYIGFGCSWCVSQGGVGCGAGRIEGLHWERLRISCHAGAGRAKSSL